MTPLAERKHSVYVMWSDETPVYVGMTSDWETRLREHGLWWTDGELRQWNVTRGWSLPVTHVDVWQLDVDRATARDVERQAIRALMPTHNRDGKPGEVFDKRRKPAVLPSPAEVEALIAEARAERAFELTRVRRVVST